MVNRCPICKHAIPADKVACASCSRVIRCSRCKAVYYDGAPTCDCVAGGMEFPPKSPPWERVGESEQTALFG
jgi:hypothetical protein